MFFKTRSGQATWADEAKLVRALYIALLERDADSDGLQHYVQQLKKNGDVAPVLLDLLGSDEFVQRFKRLHPPKNLPIDPAELTRATYLGLLGREVDPVGLRHYVEYLRDDGPVEKMLGSIINSDEFLQIFKENNPERQSAIEAALPEPAKKIHIYSNCQGSNLGRCIQALTGTKPPNFSFYNSTDMLEPKRGADAVRQALEKYDVILMQPLVAETIRKAAPELLASEKIVLFPSVSFPAFQPDQCYVYKTGTLEEVPGPLGPYHSAIAYYAWKNGHSAAQAIALFCEDTYQKLRYHEYWDSSRKALIEEGEAAGLPTEDLLESWRLQGNFMHSPNHPKLFVTATIARRLLEKLGIPMLPVDPAPLVWDNLVDAAIWPVYPEIAQRYGVRGSTLFKSNNLGLPGKSPLTFHTLEQFVERCFAAYEEHSRKTGIWCDRSYTDRYRKVFEHRQTHRPAKAITSPKTGGNNPYAGLPAQNFWRKSVQEIAPVHIDPVIKAAFEIGPETRVATAGSCFAQHISQQLRKRGFHCLLTETPSAALTPAEARHLNYGIYTARYGNLYTARQLLQLFKRAYGELVPTEEAWVRPDGQLADPFRPEIQPGGFADLATLKASREQHFAAVRQMFETLEVFVFTLGLTEGWRSKTDGAVFPLAPGVVAGNMDSSRHEFVNFSVAEVSADLDEFLCCLKDKNPAARVMLTVSPVPLAATYETRHVLLSNTYSKSVLRVAAEEITRRHPQCVYFPSYEIVTGTFSRGAYFDPDLRSVNPAGVDHVMRLFFAHYAPGGKGNAPDPELLREVEGSFRIVCEEERLAESAP